MRFLFKKAPSSGTMVEACNDPGAVWPSLTWQLAQTYPEIRRKLADITERRGLNADLKTQFLDIIVEPLLAGAASFEDTPCVIIIDALDEGMHKDQKAWATFIETLAVFSKKLSCVNHRLIVLGRDNQVIHDYFTTGIRFHHLSACSPPQGIGTNSDAKTSASEDICILLSAKLGPELDCKEPLSPSEIDQLADCSRGLFLSATTTIRTSFPSYNCQQTKHTALRTYRLSSTSRTNVHRLALAFPKRWLLRPSLCTGRESGL